jgi:hypothetical protein
VATAFQKTGFQPTGFQETAASAGGAFQPTGFQRLGFQEIALTGDAFQPNAFQYLGFQTSGTVVQLNRLGGAGRDIINKQLRLDDEMVIMGIIKGFLAIQNSAAVL